MHVFPVSANGSVEWTEWFKAFQGNVSRLHSVNYDDALNEVKEFIQGSSGVSNERIESVNKFFESIADMEPNEMLTEGMPWGTLISLSMFVVFLALCRLHTHTFTQVH